MTEEKSSDFKFRIDEESPDSVFQDEIRELRLEKLSKRVTILSILIPCLIGGLIAIAYMDLKKRVFFNQDTGARTVQDLSKDLDAKLYDLTTKYNDLENTLATRAATLEKNFSSLKFRLYKNENKIKKLGASKADKRDQETALKDLEKISSQIDALDNGVSQKFGDLATSIKNTTNDLIKIRAEISTLVTSKIDRKIFDQELQEKQQLQREKLNKIQATLDNQIRSIRNELKKLENNIASMQKASPQNPQKPLPSSPPKTGSGSDGKRPAETAKPKSGQIIEKDI
jgi:DNA repair exonuclease SbcCD ATPase subunit